jgi:hypothetical protein
MGDRRQPHLWVRRGRDRVVRLGGGVNVETVRSVDVRTEKVSMDQVLGQIGETVLYLVNEFHDADKAVMLDKLREYFNARIVTPYVE